MLEEYIRKQKSKKPILLMTHVVVGYPTLEDSFQIVREMVEAGVDLIELQIPFSDPMADGKTIIQANAIALSRGVCVDDCFRFAERVTKEFSIPFLFMTYFNIIFRRGTARFVEEMSKAGVRGAIVADLPPEEGSEYFEQMRRYHMDPILILSPNTSSSRLQFLSDRGSGFVYCVARTGVTGIETELSVGVTEYLNRCRGASKLPIAVGFGITSAKDIQFLQGKAEIAVVGSELIRRFNAEGLAGVRNFLREV